MKKRRSSSVQSQPSSILRWLFGAMLLSLSGLAVTASCDASGETLSDPIGRMGSSVSSAGVKVRTASGELPETAQGVLSSTFDGSGPLSDDSQYLCDPEEQKQVLFIGNSYTYYHHMPKMVADIAGSAGCNVKVSWATNGGYRLALHAADPVTLEAIASEDWDAIVLQNQSQRPGFRPEDVAEDSLPVVRALADFIRSQHPDVSLFYYVTWGRRDGDQLNCNYYERVCSFDGHTEALHDGYSMYAASTGGRLADVGHAFKLVVTDPYSPFHPHELYDPDGTHPSVLGSYLAASVFFYEIFGVSPEGLAFPTVLTAEKAAYLQQIAATAVEGRALTPPGASVTTEERVVATCDGQTCGPTEDLDGVNASFVLFEGTCSDWYLRTDVTEVARIATELSCNSQACTTGSVNTWTRDSGDPIPNGNYSVLVNIDVDGDGASGRGDMEACENSAVNVGSGEKVRVTRFARFETFS